MFSRALRQRLGDLAREAKPPRGAGRASAPAACATLPLFPPSERLVESVGIEEVLPGGVLVGPHGPLFIHERLYTELGERPLPLLTKLSALSSFSAENGRENGATTGSENAFANGSAGNGFGVRARLRRRSRARDLPEIAAEVESPERGLFRRYGHRRMLFLDIETCGLSAAPVFLVGLCMVGDRNLVLRQLFARDYSEERALLEELARLAREFDFLVTFNGKSFDVPFLRDRATHHRMGFSLELPHLDLLWMARRRWKHTLPDCRLKTLEWHVLRRRRAGDVSGAEIPGLYHDFVKRGEPHRLLPVFHHNLLDVVAMVELIPPLFDPDAVTY